MNPRRAEDYAFTGQLAYSSTFTSYCPIEKVFVKRTIEYVDVGRPDRVRPADDPDAQLEPDPWKMEHKKMENAHIARKQQSIDNHAAIQATLIAYLLDHGPSPTSEIALTTGININALRTHLSQRSGAIYAKLYIAGQRYTAWGLVGVHDKAAA